jgi:hypothetical protein
MHCQLLCCPAHNLPSAEHCTQGPLTIAHKHCTQGPLNITHEHFTQNIVLRGPSPSPTNIVLRYPSPSPTNIAPTNRLALLEHVTAPPAWQAPALFVDDRLGLCIYALSSACVAKLEIPERQASPTVKDVGDKHQLTRMSNDMSRVGGVKCSGIKPQHSGIKLGNER